VIGRVVRWSVALLAAGVAIACVLVAWLQDPNPIDAGDAVVAARSAFRRAGVEATVEDAAAPGVYEPVSGGGPVAVYRTTADVGGVPVVLYLRRSDAAPVYLDDRSADGASQLLSDAAFSRLIGHVDNPAADDLVVRNLLVTVAAVLIVGVAVVSLLLDPEPEPRQ
jgi:hypothetical protein